MASVMVAMFSGVHSLLVLLEGILLKQNHFFFKILHRCVNGMG